MAIEDVRAVWIMQRASGLPEDLVVNVWSARIDPAVVAQQEDLRDGLAAFYNDNQATGFNVGGYLANEIVRGVDAARLKMYRLVQGGPDVLFYNEAMPLTTAGYSADDLPSEVALVTTIVATATGTQNQRRRKGRLYIGPLNDAADTEGTGPNRPSANFRNTVAQATQSAALIVADSATLPAASGRGLGVFSRVDHAVRLIDQGWVDDAWDTQRRRGAAAVARTSWTA